MIGNIIISIVIISSTAMSFSQEKRNEQIKGTGTNYKFSISTTWHTFLNFGPDETNIQMFEFHFGYKMTAKDKLEIKIATWRLFEPLGIPLWDPLLLNESEWYPGRIREYGMGVGYQRLLLKRLFASVEILPLIKTYIDKNNVKVGNGFKLYTSYHLGYHFTLFNNRLFIEPQIHCNYWPIDTKGPQSFELKESKWNNFILFEPNLYLGVNF